VTSRYDIYNYKTYYNFIAVIHTKWLKPLISVIAQLVHQLKLVVNKRVI